MLWTVHYGEPLKVRVITNTYSRLQDDRKCLFVITEDIAWWLESVAIIGTLTLHNASTTSMFFLIINVLTKRFRLWYTRWKVTIDFVLAEFKIFWTVNQEFEINCMTFITLYYFNFVSAPTHNRICYHIQWLHFFGLMVFNATLNNISVISWRSVLLVEETGVLGGNHRPGSSHWQTLSHIVVSSTPCHERDSNSQL